jgi:hypothetical protein
VGPVGRKKVASRKKVSGTFFVLGGRKRSESEGSPGEWQFLNDDPVRGG